MTLTATWRRRLQIALALLLLVPALALGTGASEAKAASWKTIASGWATGYMPAVGLGAVTGEVPSALRIQVTNHAGKARSVIVDWYRECVKGNGKVVSADGSYMPKVGAGKTHTKSLTVPSGSIACYLFVGAQVDSPVKGKVTVKAQAAY